MPSPIIDPNPGATLCGRYTLTVDQEALSAALAVEGLVHPRPRWNVAPSQSMPVVVREGESLRGRVCRWGLVPSWARDPAIGNRLINARSETVHEKPSFRAAFRSGRCLVPADGFYEWKKGPGGKTPCWIRPDGERVFTFAGLAERWEGPGGEVLETFTLLTTDAAEAIRPIHHRMPVIVPDTLRDEWLDPSASRETLEAIMRSGPGRPFVVREVSTRVNSPAHDDPSCLEPAGPPGEDLSLFSGGDGS